MGCCSSSSVLFGRQDWGATLHFIMRQNTDGQFLPLVSATCLCVIIVLLAWMMRSKAVSKCPIFTSCLRAGWVLHCLNGPVPYCHSLSHHTDPGGRKDRKMWSSTRRWSIVLNQWSSVYHRVWISGKFNLNPKRWRYFASYQNWDYYSVLNWF